MTTLQAKEFLGIIDDEADEALGNPTSLTSKYLREMEKIVHDFLKNGGILDLSSIERMHGMLEATFHGTSLAPNIEILYSPIEFPTPNPALVRTPTYFFYSSPDLGWWVHAEIIKNRIVVKYRSEGNKEEISRMRFHQLHSQN